MTPVDAPTPAVCVDVGSTWTMAALVGADGLVMGFAEHPTTVRDVLAGMDAAVRAVTATGLPGSEAEPTLLACSSAGGGLPGGVFRRYDPVGGLGAVGATLRADPKLADVLSKAALVLDTAFTVVTAGLLAAGDRSQAADAVPREQLLD